MALGLVVLAAGLCLALWPISADGVQGNAVQPQYGDFGWFAYSPLPDHLTVSDLRRAGVTVPQDAVAGRRRLAATVAGLGVSVAAVGLVLRRRWQ